MMGTYIQPATGLDLTAGGTINGDLTVTGNLTVQGTTTSVVNQTTTGTITVTVANAAALAVGPNGNTNPTFRVVTNTASAATGIAVTGAAAAGGLAVSVISSGADESATFDAKGTGTLTFNATATGAIRFGQDLLFVTDNTDDIGATNATRPRNIYVGSSVIWNNGATTYGFRVVAGSFAFDGGSAFPTAIKLETATNQGFQINSGGHFLALTDNVYDIGATNATRPRTVYVGTSVTWNDGATTYAIRCPGGVFGFDGGSNYPAGIKLETASGAGFQVSAGHLLPTSDASSDIGSATFQVRNVYISGSITMGSADIVTDVTTGMKIGTGTTQKLGFWNATPVVQSAGIVDADGTLADITTKFNSLLGKMETYGLLAVA